MKKVKLICYHVTDCSTVFLNSVLGTPTCLMFCSVLKMGTFFLFRACLLGSRLGVFMFVRSVMIIRSSALCVLHTVWSIFWYVAHRSCYSTISHSVCLRTVMVALILSLKTEFWVQLDCNCNRDKEDGKIDKLQCHKYFLYSYIYIEREDITRPRYEISLLVLRNVIHISKWPCENTNEIPNHFAFASKGVICCVTIAVVIFEITCEDNMLFSCVKIPCEDIHCIYYNNWTYLKDKIMSPNCIIMVVGYWGMKLSQVSYHNL